MTAFALLATGTVLLAQQGSAYVGFGIGGSFLNNGNFTASNDVPVEGEIFEEVVTTDIDLETSNSLAWSGFIGWQATDTLALELEYASQLYRVDDDNLDDDFPITPFYGVPDGLTTSSLLAVNAVFSLPTSNGHRPYIGVGIGRASTDSEEDQLAFDDDDQFGYQIKAGYEFLIGRATRIGIQGRYMAAAEPYQRTFERNVTQPDGSELPQTLTEELEFDGFDVSITLRGVFGTNR